MAEAKDLNYYMANPDELPEDADLGALANGFDEAAPADEQDAKGDSSDTKEAAVEVKADEPKQEDPKLLSKNGKDEIPYQVLVTERERRAAAEKAAEELRQRLADIESQVKAGGQKQEQEVAPVEQAIDDADLKQLSEDFPTIGKVIAMLQEKVIAAEQKLKEVGTIEQQRIDREVVASRNTVQEAIDSTPALSYWQNEDHEMFAKAIEFDNILKADARNANLTLEQRFEKVVLAMESVYGQADLPEAYRPKSAPRQDMNELTEKAKSVVKEAGSFKPKSLSDIPGGTPPSATESEKFEAMSPAQLAAMMQGMDADAINVMLAKLG